MAGRHAKENARLLHSRMAEKGKKSFEGKNWEIFTDLSEKSARRIKRYEKRRNALHILDIEQKHSCNE